MPRPSITTKHERLYHAAAYLANTRPFLKMRGGVTAFATDIRGSAVKAAAASLEDMLIGVGVPEELAASLAAPELGVGVVLAGVSVAGVEGVVHAMSDVAKFVAAYRAGKLVDAATGKPVTKAQFLGVIFSTLMVRSSGYAEGVAAKWGVAAYNYATGSHLSPSSFDQARINALIASAGHVRIATRAPA